MKTEINSFQFRRLSTRIGVVIIVTEMVADWGWGFFYITRFTGRLKRLAEKVSVTRIFNVKGLLSYQSAEDKGTMESLVEKPSKTA
ncbi:MAG: hypothetical protein U0T82_06490 [Bacteroidales bacterium]